MDHTHICFSTPNELDADEKMFLTRINMIWDDRFTLQSQFRQSVRNIRADDSEVGACYSHMLPENSPDYL